APISGRRGRTRRRDTEGLRCGTGISGLAPRNVQRARAHLIPERLSGDRRNADGRVVGPQAHSAIRPAARARDYGTGSMAAMDRNAAPDRRSDVEGPV